ncbi:hypothetical protein HPB48_003353 [Haemaphysalis longicornis]|uniref:Uncharacterized protein n=1 Tax=Haemaphysalis longicornis TaxID=44386 RepID=A0A9J6GVU2_HAELO|nr:hypothetical protein HPB48_003353 [Haemaphysalis longicornis]
MTGRHTRFSLLDSEVEDWLSDEIARGNGLRDATVDPLLPATAPTPELCRGGADLPDNRRAAQESYGSHPASDGVRHSESPRDDYLSPAPVGRHHYTQAPLGPRQRYPSRQPKRRAGESRELSSHSCRRAARCRRAERFLRPPAVTTGSNPANMFAKEELRRSSSAPDPAVYEPHASSCAANASFAGAPPKLLRLGPHIASLTAALSRDEPPLPSAAVDVIQALINTVHAQLSTARSYRLAGRDAPATGELEALFCSKSLPLDYERSMVNEFAYLIELASEAKHIQADIFAARRYRPPPPPTQRWSQDANGRVRPHRPCHTSRQQQRTRSDVLERALDPYSYALWARSDGQQGMPLHNYGRGQTAHEEPNSYGRVESSRGPNAHHDTPTLVWEAKGTSQLCADSGLRPRSRIAASSATSAAQRATMPARALLPAQRRKGSTIRETPTAVGVHLVTDGYGYIKWRARQTRNAAGDALHSRGRASGQGSHVTHPRSSRRRDGSSKSAPCASESSRGRSTHLAVPHAHTHRAACQREPPRDGTTSHRIPGNPPSPQPLIPAVAPPYNSGTAIISEEFLGGKSRALRWSKVERPPSALYQLPIPTGVCPRSRHVASSHNTRNRIQHRLVPTIAGSLSVGRSPLNAVKRRLRCGLLNWQTWCLGEEAVTGASQLAAPEHFKSCSSGLVPCGPGLHTVGARPRRDWLFLCPHYHGGRPCGGRCWPCRTNDWLKRPLLSEETSAHLRPRPVIYFCCPGLLFLGCPTSGDYKDALDTRGVVDCACGVVLLRDGRTLMDFADLC